MPNVNSDVITLPVETWIASDFQELEFAVYNFITQEPVDLTTFSEVGWVLFRYGNSGNPVLTLKGTVVALDNSKFDVYVDSELTENLGGEAYIQQPFLIDSNGTQFWPAQGLVYILSRGNKDNSDYIQQA